MDLTSVQAGRLLGVSEKTVYRLIRHGFLASHKIGGRRQHWIKQEELTRFREQHPSLPTLPPEKRYYVAKGGQHTEKPEYKAERLAHARAAAEKRGGECLSASYEHSHVPLLWRCASGHEWRTTIGHVVSKKTWCPQCRGRKVNLQKPLTPEERKRYIAEHHILEYQIDHAHRQSVQQVRNPTLNYKP